MGELQTKHSMKDKYNQYYHNKNNTLYNKINYQHMSHYPKNRIEAIIHSTINVETLLEVGCGDGHLLSLLRDKYSKCIGIEYSELRLRRVKENLKDVNFVGINGSVEDMSMIASESIDCIVSADTIEHVPDIYSAADEMYRVLKPGGMIVINTPNIAFIKKRLQLLFGRFPSTSQPNEGFGDEIMYDGGHLHYFTLRSLKKLLVRSGFIIQGSNGYGPFGFIHNIYPKLLSGGIQVTAVKSSNS